MKRGLNTVVAQVFLILVLMAALVVLYTHVQEIVDKTGEIQFDFRVRSMQEQRSMSTVDPTTGQIKGISGEVITSQYNITRCTNLTDDNSIYYLETDLFDIDVVEDCMNINANNVILDCKGHTIINPALDGALIHSYSDYVEIRNCNLKASSAYLPSLNNGKGKGVFSQGKYNYIHDNNVSSTFWGIAVYGTSHLIENNYLKGNAKAIHLGGDYHRVLGNVLVNNNLHQGWGLGVWVGKNNLFERNVINGSRYGVVLYDASNTQLRCNKYLSSSSMDLYIYAVPWYSWVTGTQNSNITSFGENYSRKSVGAGAELISLDGSCDVAPVLPSNYASNVTKNGITWYFDKPYQIGQFVNGDYWVLDNGSGVNITLVDPMPYLGRNGNMINPKIGQQAFHNNSGAYNSSLAVYFPRVLRIGESLVSTRSINSSHNDGVKSAGTNSCGCVYDLSNYCVYNDPKPGCYQHAMVYQGAVLTVLGEVPISDSFRPSYVSGDKTIYRLSSIAPQRSLLLSLNISNKPNITRQALVFENVWLDTVMDSPGRLMRPVKNGPTYGEHFSSNVGDSALLLNLNYTPSEKERLLINYLQLGIDLYSITLAGGNWPNGGGHDQGRKMPIIFAGVMFNNPEMKNVQAEFSEVTHVYAGKNTDNQYVARYGWVVDPCTGTYALSSNGCWGIVSSSGAKDCYNPAGLYDTCGYQGNIIYPWVGQSLVMRYMYDINSKKYAREIYNHSYFFDFVDRWMNKDVAPSYSDSATGIAKSVWDKYRYCVSDADCVGHPLGQRCLSASCYLEDCSGWNKKECTP